MKKIICLAFLGIAFQTSFAQLQWQKNGNNNLPLGLSPTIGTSAAWNSPFITITNGINRMKLNQTLNYVVSGGTGLQVRDGFMLLSSQPSPTLFAPTFGAFSLLHLNGINLTLI